MNISVFTVQYAEVFQLSVYKAPAELDRELIPVVQPIGQVYRLNLVEAGNGWCAPCACLTR